MEGSLYFVAGAFATAIIASSLWRFRHPAGAEWSAAWVAVYLSALVAASDDHVPQIAPFYPLLGTTFAALFFAGARRSVGQPVPAWFWSVVAAVALTRAALQPFASPGFTQAGGALVVGLGLSASAVTLLQRPEGRRGLPLGLALSFIALVGASVFYAFAKSQGGALLAASMFAFFTIASLVGALQVALASRETLRNIEARRAALAATFEAVPLGLAWSDESGTVQAANRVLLETLELPAESMVGAPVDVLGEALAGLVARDQDRRSIVDASSLRAAATSEFHFRDGRRVIGGVHPVVAEPRRNMGRLWSLNDVTAERKLRDELDQARRLETLGQLAGGVAHDFNNKLTSVLGNAALLAESLDPDDPRQAELRDLEDAARYCADLTRGLLDFSRQSPRDAGVTDLAAVIDACTSEMRRQHAAVSLEVSVEPGLPPARGGRTEIERMLTNLLQNARDAAPEGRVFVSARVGEGGAAVELAVRDDGAGMDAETRERIFDPFFSTKRHTGTGLGLSIVYGIARGCGGDVSVESEPGQGSCFRVTLPTGRVEPAPNDTAPNARVRPGRDRTVLLVEDETSVRRLLVGALERGGYRVIEASGAEEALHEGLDLDAVTLVVADLRLPGLSGLELIDRLRARKPDLPAMIVSGNLEEFRSDADAAGLPVLEKPFRPSELLRAATRAIEAETARAPT